MSDVGAVPAPPSLELELELLAAGLDVPHYGGQASRTCTLGFTG